MTKPQIQPVRPTKVRSMQRGLRALADRGVSARPAAADPAYFVIGGASRPRIMLARAR